MPRHAVSALRVLVLTFFITVTPRVVAAPEPNAVQSCAARAKAMQPWLDELQSEASRARVPGLTNPTARLVEHKGEEVSARTLIEVAGGRITVNGRSLGGDSALPSSFEEQLALLDASIAGADKSYTLLQGEEKAPPDIALALDRDVEWQQVVAVTSRLARAGRTSFDFVFHTPLPPRKHPPEPSSVERELAAVRDTADPWTKSVVLAQTWERVVLSCPAVQELFAAIAKVHPNDKLKLIAARLPAAVTACECAIDIAALHTLFYATWGADQSAAYSGVTVRLAPPLAPRSNSVAAAPTAVWSSVFRRLLDAARAKREVSLELAAH